MGGGGGLREQVGAGGYPTGKMGQQKQPPEREKKNSERHSCQFSYVLSDDTEQDSVSPK